MAARSRKTSDYDIARLRHDVEAGTFKPIYLVLGAEPLLAEEAVDLIVNAAVSAESRDFNLNVYSADDEASKQFLSQSETFPFMSERRVVVVRRFEKMSLRDSGSERTFLKYLDKPVTSTVLVLVADKLDRRMKISQRIEKAASIVNVDELAKSALPRWVESRFRLHGMKVDSVVCTKLVQLVGTVLLDLRNEVDKVAIRFAGAKRIGEREVVSTVGSYRAEEVWAITKALRPENMTGFLNALSRVLETDDSPIRLCALMVNHVNSLLRIKLLGSKGVRSKGELARKMRIPPFFLDDRIPQAQAFSKKQLVLWMRNLQRADVQMKSVRLPQRWVLERALMNSFLEQEMN